MQQRVIFVFVFCTFLFVEREVIVLQNVLHVFRYRERKERVRNSTGTTTGRIFCFCQNDYCIIATHCSNIP
jgi:hypothetical protein